MRAAKIHHSSETFGLPAHSLILFTSGLKDLSSKSWNIISFLLGSTPNNQLVCRLESVVEKTIARRRRQKILVIYGKLDIH